jgi:copper oxidase (laccase) domain-containing protein
MTREFRSDPDDLVAAIGPSLGPCCGEVGDEVAEAFAQAGHDTARLARWFSRGASGRLHVDLWAANADLLIAAGLRAERVHVARLCTKTHADLFHSFRAAREHAGRMVAAVRSRTDP